MKIFANDHSDAVFESAADPAHASSSEKRGDSHVGTSTGRNTDAGGNGEAGPGRYATHVANATDPASGNFKETAKEKIEITKEMIDAGVDILRFSFDSEHGCLDDAVNVVREIYLSMDVLRRKEVRDEHAELVALREEVAELRRVVAMVRAQADTRVARN